MPRTISEIKESIVANYTSNAEVRKLYGYADNETFTLSKVGIENIVFYVCACAIYILECLFDKHTEEIEEYIRENLPHTLRWYSNIAKAYQHGQTFDIDTMDWDYGTSNPSDEDIASYKIVKNCAVSENGILVLMKIAKQGANGPEPLSASEFEGFKSYMSKVKDAGVALVYRNDAADHLRLTVNIWYDPTVMQSDGTDIDENSKNVEDCIKNYVSSLPFNGEFHIDKLEDEIQKVQGVEVVHITQAQTHDSVTASPAFSDILGYASPYAGYYKFYKPEDLVINYNAYHNDEN